MASFPQLLTTGATRDLQTIPMQYQPLSLLPLIEMLRQQPKTASGGATPSNKFEDDKIEGRMGAVNQYTREAAKYRNAINTGADLYGTAFYSMPEYAQAVRGYENATSDERKNTIARQTADLKRFEDNIKGKGSFYHLGELKRTGKLKKSSEWQDIQEKGFTRDLGEGSDYVEDFDYDPIFFGMEDARQAADAVYDKHGHLSVSGAEGAVKESILGSMYGIKKTYTSSMNKQNYDNMDERGNVIDLNRAHEQAMARAIGEGLDITDPLSAGYFQGFLQRQGGFDKYINKKGFMDEDSWSKLDADYKKFVESDLASHFNKRKEKDVGSEYREDFTEANEQGYAGYGKMQAVEIALASQKSEQGSYDAVKTAMDEASLLDMIGMPDIDALEKDVAAGKGGLLGSVQLEHQQAAAKEAGFSNAKDYQEYIKNKLFEGDDSFLVKTKMADGTWGFDINPEVTTEQLQGKYEALKKEGMDKFGNEQDAKEFADNLFGKLNEAAMRTGQAMSQGKGTSYMGRDNVFKAVIDANHIKSVLSEALQNDNMLGKDVGQTGNGINVYVGETAMDLADFSGFTMENRAGSLNIMPTAGAQNYGVLITEPQTVGGVTYKPGQIVQYRDIQHLREEDQRKIKGEAGFWMLDMQGKPVIGKDGRPTADRPNYTGASIMASTWETAGRVAISEAMAEAGSPQAWAASAGGYFMNGEFSAPKEVADKKLKSTKVWKETYPINAEDKKVVKTVVNKAMGNSTTKEALEDNLAKELGLSPAQTAKFKEEMKNMNGTKVSTFGYKGVQTTDAGSAVIAKYHNIAQGKKGAQNIVLTPKKALVPIMDEDGKVDPQLAMTLNYRTSVDKDGKVKTYITLPTESTGVIESQMGYNGSAGPVKALLEGTTQRFNQQVKDNEARYQAKLSGNDEKQGVGTVSRKTQPTITGVKPQPK